MNKLILVFLVFIFSPNLYASDNPSREDVMEYFKSTNTFELLKGYADSYVVVLRRSYPKLSKEFYSDPDFLAAMNSYEERILKESISIIVNNVSKSDLKEITDFLKTDLGKKMLRLNKITDPLFLDSGTQVNVWLNEKVGPLLYKHGAR